jgi:hypothetical protein
MFHYLTGNLIYFIENQGLLTMHRNSVKKIWDALTVDNEAQPEYKKMSKLNHHVYLVKEMDSAKNRLEIDHAITELKRWQDTRQQKNDSLSLSKLKEKRKVLSEASSQFNSRFYLMMTFVVANATTISSIMYAVIVSELSMGEKSLALGAAGVGMVEGTIHLYKAKRFFAQKYELTKIELESVNIAIAKKTCRA